MIACEQTITVAMVKKARKEKSGQQGSLIVCWAAEQTAGTTKEIPVVGDTPQKLGSSLSPAGAARFHSKLQPYTTNKLSEGCCGLVVAFHNHV